MGLREGVTYQAVVRPMRLRTKQLLLYNGCPSHQDVEALSSVRQSVLPFVFVFADLALIYASARHRVGLKMGREMPNPNLQHGVNCS